jgi:hypothetical protein
MSDSRDQPRPDKEARTTPVPAQVVERILMIPLRTCAIKSTVLTVLADLLAVEDRPEAVVVRMSRAPWNFGGGPGLMLRR